MTLLVGLACTDGVIIGADSASTYVDSQGQPTIKQIQPGKIKVIQNQLLVASSGQVGMSQRWATKLDDMVKNGRIRPGNIPTQSLVERLEETIVGTFETAIRFGLSFSSLVAVNTKDGPRLLELTSQDRFQPEIKDSSHWYVSLGSGQANADPMLAFYERVFWAEGQPSLEDGIFATMFILEFAVGMSPGHVSAPFQIATLNESGIEKYDDDLLSPYLNRVDEAVNHFRGHAHEAPEEEPPTSTM